MPHNKIRIVLGFALVSLIFICLRAKTLNHLLMWDEARNIIALRAFLGNNAADPFYPNYFFHPPLYMAFAGLLLPFKAGLNIRLELLSLLFSYATLLAVYLLSARIGGWKYAFFSGLFLSVMPVSIAYDTWIKRDGLASALGYFAVFLLLKRKFLWCAVALSFSLLAKESALFFVIAVTWVLFTMKESGVLKKLLGIYGIVFALTSWWYLCLSDMPKVIFDIYFSAEKNISSWSNSPLYYLKKLLPDAGAPILFFLIIGACYSLYLIFGKKRHEWSAPLAIVLSVYIPGSLIIACKTPWLCLSAGPALAMIAGAGALFLLKEAGKSRFTAAVLALFLILSIFAGGAFSYAGYHAETYPNGWSGANSSRELALYLNERMKDGERLMMTEFSYWMTPVCPVFLYYWGGKPIYVIDGKDEAGEIVKQIEVNRISWLAVIDSRTQGFNFRKLVKALAGSALGKGAAVGSSYVWKISQHR